MNYLCKFSSVIFGSKLIRCADVEIISTDYGYRVNDYPAGAIGLRFNHDGLQIDQDDNVLSDPYYWLEP